MNRFDYATLVWSKIVGAQKGDRRRANGRSRKHGAAAFVSVPETLEDRRLLTTALEPIKDIDSRVDRYGQGYGSSSRDLTQVGDLLFFVADDGVHGAELWKTDGTELGTKMVKDISTGERSSRPNSLINLNGTLFFGADDGTGNGFELWMSNGFEDGTRVFPATLTAPGTGNPNPHDLTVINGTLFFTARYANPYDALFSTDGTLQGTVRLTPGPGPAGSPAPPSPVGRVEEFNGKFYFPASSPGLGTALWVTDGTLGGTKQFIDINAAGNSDPANLMNVGGTLYFTAHDETYGEELWATDGTVSGTKMMADIRTDAGSSWPREMTNLNGVLYFKATIQTGDRSAAETLWKSNGTPETTLQVLPFETMVSPTQLRNIDGKLYFSGFTDMYGNEPWVLDGSGVRQIRDIDDRGGPRASSDPKEFTAHEGVAYFSAFSREYGREIWRSDGSNAGTELLVDISGDWKGSNPANFVIIGNRLYFTADTVERGLELYAIDLLKAPTVLAPSTPTAQQRPLIQWTSVAGAASYDLQIFLSVGNFPDGPTTVLVIETTVSGTSYLPTADLGIGVFHARVRAVSSGGQKSPLSADFRFQIDTPVTLSPMARQQNTARPTVSWTALPGAAGYDLWVNNLSTGQSQAVRKLISGTSWTPASDLPLGRYRVWVRGIGAASGARWSSPLDFDVVAAPTLTSPQYATFNRRPTFAWTAVTGATKYEVFVRNLNNGVTTYDVRNITTTSWTPPANLPDGPYRWWVQATSANNVTSLWSAPTDVYIGGRTTVTGPVGSTGDSTPTFTWRPVNGAVRYELWVSNAVTQAPVIYQTALTGTSYTPTTGLAKGSYRVWVRAVSVSGENAVWSAVLTFSVVDNTPLQSEMGHPLLASLRSEQQNLMRTASIKESAPAPPRQGGEVAPDVAGRQRSENACGYVPAAEEWNAAEESGLITNTMGRGLVEHAKWFAETKSKEGTAELSAKLCEIDRFMESYEIEV